MGIVVSIVNHKGGVGKTTTAVNLAAGLAETGDDVLLVDLDPQGSASLHLGVADDGRRLLRALQASDALPVAETALSALSLVPSGPELVAARERFTGAAGRDLLTRCLRRTPGPWQWILIDCPPSLGVLTTNALRASRYMVIPVEASYLALKGLDQMIAVLEDMRDQNQGLEIAAIVPCRAHPRRRVHKEIMARLEERFPRHVTPVVRENVSLAEAPAKARPVLLSAGRSHGAEDYRAVCAWLREHVTAP